MPPDLLQSPSFWFGAIVFLLSQWGKFSELSAQARSGATRSTLLLELKPRDLTNASTFNLALLAFLGMSLLVYYLICILPPSIFSGWSTLVTGTNPLAQTKTSNNLELYPLIIAASLVGLTQPIPIFDKIANFQKELFHHWIGIPERVVGVSAHFATRILARLPDGGQLSEMIDKLLSDQWLDSISEFSDIGFYKEQIHRIKLDKDAEIAEVKNGSSREKKFVIQELLLAACVAAVRRDGGAALPKLAQTLEVSMPYIAKPQTSYMGGGVLVALVSAIILCFILPLSIIKAPIQSALSVQNSNIWPETIYYSWQYILINFIPIIISAFIVFTRLNIRKMINGSSPVSTSDILNRNYATIMLVFVAIIIYDYAQAFADRGATDQQLPIDIYAFLTSRLPYFAVHALISTLCSFVIISFIAHSAAVGNFYKLLAWGAALSATAALTSYFHALVKQQFQYTIETRPQADFVALVVALNVISAVVAFSAIILAIKQIKSEPQNST